MPFQALTETVDESAVGTLAAVRAARERRGELAGALSQALYEAVPAAPVADRRRLLRLRRDLANDRVVAPALLAAGDAHLAEKQRLALADWALSRHREDVLLTAARQRLAEELDLTRRRLAALASEPPLAQGIQLSGDVLARRVAEFAACAESGQALPKKLRGVEHTLVSLAHRCALKPSPYGAFTTVGFWPLDTPKVGDASEPSHRRPVVHLNRTLLDWMSGVLLGSRHGSGLGVIRLNNTLRVSDEELEVYTAGPVRCEQERFRRIPLAGATAVAVSALRQGPLTRAELLAVLDRVPYRPVDPGRELDELLRLGVCEHVLGAPDEQPEYAASLAAVLPDGPFARVFASLAAVERAFGKASLAKREQLLTRTRQLVSDFGAHVGSGPPPQDALRTVLYEDMRGDSGPQWWRPDALAANGEAFALLQRLLPLFDNTAFAQTGLYRFFVEKYGERGECRDVLELYRALLRLSPEERARVLQGAEDPEVSRCHRMRARFTASMDRRIAAAPDAPCLELDAPWLGEFVGALPRCLPPWLSATYLVQFHGTRRERPGLVVNEVRSGKSAFYARFLDSGARLSTVRQRNAVAEADPRQADMTAVFGENYNVHPRLTPFVVEYPGARSGFADALSLRDLVVRADGENRRLKLVCRRDGVPLSLMPLNAGQPAGAPELYRFLHLFAPSAAYRPGWLWQLYVATRGRREREGVLRLPRLSLGEVVVERRTWRVPVKAVAGLLVGARDRVELLLAAASWREANALPRRCFFRMEDGLAPDTGSLGRTARSYKPHYLDFDSALLLEILCRSLAAGPAEAELVLQECLPDVDSYTRPGAPSSAAEELAVEYSLDLPA
ncbi:hypothetical protein QFZ66_002468 [Streptomyces sp. B4I13]|uniref:hypothetical protein n=1 Tax=Streptomyces sp. B4I13 TaxID=3042271 RepID=UPI0027815DC3|nr:hypothetical protein [Streptomyces sp. B4I13]MDQ0958590.1 hypothetical protein [Streptomyces sp. B4I13]